MKQLLTIDDISLFAFQMRVPAALFDCSLIWRSGHGQRGLAIGPVLVAGVFPSRCGI